MRRVAVLAMGVLLVAVVTTSSIQADHTQPSDAVDEWVDEHGDMMTGPIAWENGELDGTVGSEGLYFDGQRVCVEDTDEPGCAAAGDISAVNAGFGLQGGGQVGNVTLTAKTDEVQRRLSETCTGSQAIKEIHQDGSVDCISVSGGTQETSIAPVHIRPEQPSVSDIGAGKHRNCYRLTATAYKPRPVSDFDFQDDCGEHFLGLTLPDDATLHRVEIHVVDTVTATLIEHPVGSSSTNTLAADSTTDPGDPGETLVMSNLGYTIDNANNTLQVKFSVEPSDFPGIEIRDTVVTYAE